MRFWIRALQIVLPLVVLGVATLAAFIMISNRPEVATQIPTVAPPGVRAHLVEVNTIQVPVKSQGTVRPRTETQLVPQVAGRVTWVAPSFAAGGFFEEGDVLLRIDPFDYEQTVISSRSQLAQSRLRLAQEEAEAEVARREWEELGQGNPRALTLREPQLEDARAAVAAAEAGLIRAERDLERADLKAPYAGRVRNKTVDVGQFVTVGAAIATIYSVDIAEIRLPLPDEQLAYLDLPLAYRGIANQNGPQVKLRTTFAGATYEWTGQVVRTEGEIDPVSRMVHVVAEVRDPYSAGPDPNRPPLAVGMYVEAEIEGRTFNEIVVVPRSALQGRNQVLTIDSDNRVWFREIDILRTTTGSVYVRSGLGQGEIVAVSALDGPTDGMRVQVTDLSMGTIADRQTSGAIGSTSPAAMPRTELQQQIPPTGNRFGTTPTSRTESQQQIPPTGNRFGTTPTRRKPTERPEWLVRVYRENTPPTPIAQLSPKIEPSGKRSSPRVVETPVGVLSPISTPPSRLSELPLESPMPTEGEIVESSDPKVFTAFPKVVDHAGTVTVLPFTNISQDRTTDALGARLAEDLSTRLNEIKSITLVSSKIDAGLIVGGGVQRLGDKVRVTARIVDTHGGEVVRAVKVDGVTNDLERIRRKVASEIETEIVEVIEIVAASQTVVEAKPLPIIGGMPLPVLEVIPLLNIDAGLIPLVPTTSTRITVRDFSNVSQVQADLAVAHAIGNAVAKRLVSLENISVVAEESSAALIVSGGIQRVGNIVRVTASLIDSVTGSVVRATKVDGLVNRLVQLQREVATALSDSVREATS